MPSTLRLLPYDSAWPSRFAVEAARLRPALGAAVQAIEHVGSTAVPGLAGKPVLDIAIAVENDANADTCIAPMQALGYEYRGPYGDDPRRRYYVRSENGASVVHAHLYVLPAAAWHALLAFRDVLRTDAALSAAYAAEKYRVAESVGWDKSAYSLAKGPFVQQVLRHERAVTMTEPIRFNDGASYERYMGVWSQLAGAEFLRWLAPAPGLRWLDVGCGNGAFTEMLATHCAPAALYGIDPSAAQLEYARTRAPLRDAELREGDAMALPYGDDQFDAAVMPLVIFFVPKPATGVAEMVRVVGAGGLVAAYAWDMHGGGFPYHLLQREIRELGAVLPAPPTPESSRREVMVDLWRGAGLIEVETQELTVQRSFTSFDDYWATVAGWDAVGRTLATLAPEAIARLQERLRHGLPTDADGRITYNARANAVKGRVPTAPAATARSSTS
ncbi:GrpB family protein [Gemmatimonas sp.]|uniref:GrpB family protein n=1 Tax=Gemmatimonas sp. TaxID=1962908 RepID=UPI003983607F